MVFVKRFAAVLALAVLPAWPGALVRAQAPDLILHNGKVVTVDPAFSIAEGVAIRGDRFVAVGTNAAVRRLAGPATRVIDLRGRTVIPGLMDGHLHNAGGGPGVKLAAEEILAQMKLLNAAGLTGIRIPGQFQFGGSAVEPYRMFQQLKAQGKLTIRVNYLMRIFDYSSVEKMRETIASWNVRPDEGDEWLRIGGMKTLVDGGFEGGYMRTAYEEPFGKGGKFRGIQVVPLSDYVAAVRELNRLGWRVATHAVGDAAIDQVLDAYAAADRDRSIRGQRWSVVHFLIGPPDHYPRVKALDLVISAQDHLYRAGPSLIKYWGRERAEQVTPVRSFLDQS